MIASAQPFDIIRTEPEAIRSIERSLMIVATSPFDGDARSALGDAVNIARGFGLDLAELGADLRRDIKRRFAPPSGCAVGVICDCCP